MQSRISMWDATPIAGMLLIITCAILSRSCVTTGGPGDFVEMRDEKGGLIHSGTYGGMAIRICLLRREEHTCIWTSLRESTESTIRFDSITLFVNGKEVGKVSDIVLDRTGTSGNMAVWRMRDDCVERFFALCDKGNAYRF